MKLRKLPTAAARTPKYCFDPLLADAVSASGKHRAHFNGTAICRLIFTMGFVLLCAGLARAQNASLSGLILDTSSAVVPQVSVQLRNPATGVVLQTESNTAGAYTFPFVQPGVYDVTVSKTGFETIVRTSVTLSAAQSARSDFTLAVGAATQTVEVTAASATVNTTDATVSTVVNRQFVQNLPLNGRSFQSLLLLAPGLNLNVGAGPSNFIGNTYAQGQFIVDGQRGDMSYWMVDGVSGNIGVGIINGGAGMGGAIGATNVLGGTNALVSVDDMQEFRVETCCYAPEFGRSPGGQISVVTRSGTNQLHGTLFEYLRNTVFDSADWFADNQGLPKAAEIQNDFGGVIGGPIRKDKTFFFFSYEGLRMRQPYTFLGTVPSLASRSAPTDARVIPYLNSYPRPTANSVPVGTDYVSYSATYSNPGAADAYSLRIDHQLTKNLNLFARANDVPSSTSPRGYSGQPASVVSRFKGVTKTLTLGATWALSPRVVNDLRFNYGTSGGTDVYSEDGFGGAVPFVNNNLFSPGFTLANSVFNIVPLFGNNMTLADGHGTEFFQHQYNLTDAFSVQMGSHGLKFGVDYRRLTPYENVYNEEYYPLFFDMSQLESDYSPVDVIIHQAPVTFLFHNLSAYAQDSWRVNSRLNLTYGVRWDVDFSPKSLNGAPPPAITGFSLTDLSNLALAPVGTAAWGTRYSNLAPRIGGAYQLRTKPDWGLVLRGGFGVFYALADTEFGTQAVIDDLYPWGTYIFPPADPFTTSPGIPAIVAPNAANGFTLFGFDPHLNVPYALEWSVALEQSLGTEQTLTASYVGAADKRMLGSEFVNSPSLGLTNFSSANLLGNTGIMNYDALQVQFQRAMAHGLQALISYTYSHSLDEGSYGAYLNGTFADPKINYGNSDYDLRHVFSAAVVYQLPALKANGFTRAITDGWATDNSLQLRTGPPVDVLDNNFGALSVASPTQFRPDVVPGQPLYLTGSHYPGGKALNPAAFTDPPVDESGLPTRQGDLARNSLRSLGLRQWDAAVRRDFAIHDQIKLQFRADMFNALNHPNFGAFNNDFLTGNPLFGQATEMLNQALGAAPGSGQQNPLYSPGGPRSIELALKLNF